MRTVLFLSRRIDDSAPVESRFDPWEPPSVIPGPTVLPNMGELETEEQKSRAEIATYLRDMADQLDGGGDVTLDLGGTGVQMSPTEPVTFKLEGESDWSQGDTEAKQSIEFELVWWREAATAEEGSLDVQE
ncbi:MAG TPA: amphi-Trp domain-containing protein [Natronoarchaeum rubrum]|nr:amphi-Trp domain-containing protein [Natronoarchaeum rubrum]